MLKRLALLLTVLSLLASLVEAVHFHEDAADHPLCSICAALHYSALPGENATVPEVVRDFVETPYPQPVQAIVGKSFFSSFNSRAPPLCLAHS